MPRVRGRPHLYGAPDYGVPLPPPEPLPVEKRVRARWLMAVVERFGVVRVGEWQNAPEGWDYATWCARADAREAGSA